MDTRYIERFESLGYEIKVCKSIKEFIQDIKDRCTWNPYGDISFKKYMNDEIAGYHNCISNGWLDEDASIFIQYKDRTTYSFYPGLGADGKFRENGIEWAIISDGYGYTTYKNDLSAEWEFLELGKDEEKAIELGISIENYKAMKKQAQEQEHPAEYTEKGAEETAEVFPKPGEEQEPEQEQEQAQEENFLFTPSNFLAKPEFKIDILGALKEAGYNTGYIRKHKIFPESTVQKFRSENTDISISTIFRVCQILNKDISDVIRFKKE